MEFTELAQLILKYSNPALVAFITCASGFTIPFSTKLLKKDLDSTEKRICVFITGLVTAGTLSLLEPTMFTSAKELLIVATASSIASLGGYASVKNMIQKSNTTQSIEDDGTVNT